MKNQTAKMNLNTPPILVLIKFLVNLSIFARLSLLLPPLVQDPGGRVDFVRAGGSTVDAFSRYP